MNHGEEINKRIDVAIHSLSEFGGNVIVLVDYDDEEEGFHTHGGWHGNGNAVEGLCLNVVRDGLGRYSEFDPEADEDWR
jgi:hypothetical protein